MLSQISGHIKYDIRTYRNHRNEEVSAKDKILTAGFAATGTLLPMLYFSKKQNTKLFNIKFGLKEMIITSAGAILGGLIGGLTDKSIEHRKQKVNEGVFQFMNASVPTILTASGFSLCNKIKTLNKPVFKVPTALAGLIGGMHIAAKLSNKINDPYDKIPDRKLTIKDSLANIDDTIGVLILSKIPLAEKIQAEKTLPLIYGWCGYRAGMSN